MDIDTFQKFIQTKELINNKPLLILVCLNYVEVHPETVFTIGVFWKSPSSFYMKTSFFCKFTGLIENTVTSNLNHHYFVSTPTNKQMRKTIPEIFQTQGDFGHGWIEWKSEGFTKNTSENQASHWRSTQHPPRRNKRSNQRKKEGTNKNDHPEIEIEIDLFDRVFDSNDINNLILENDEVHFNSDGSFMSDSLNEWFK